MISTIRRVTRKIIGLIALTRMIKPRKIAILVIWLLMKILRKIYPGTVAIYIRQSAMLWTRVIISIVLMNLIYSKNTIILTIHRENTDHIENSTDTPNIRNQNMFDLQYQMTNEKLSNDKNRLQESNNFKDNNFAEETYFYTQTFNDEKKNSLSDNLVHSNATKISREKNEVNFFI